jgi:hypothetical protein
LFETEGTFGVVVRWSRSSVQFWISKSEWRWKILTEVQQQL